jgi:fluoride exporter
VTSWTHWCAVGVGAAVGAWTRWLLALAFNPLFPSLPLGTLAANGIGGFFIGVAVEYFTGNASVPPEVKLLVITGFLGGLTTFSTFSAEAVGLIAKQQIGWALAHVGAHLAASLTLTAVGIWMVRLLRG